MAKTSFQHADVFPIIARCIPRASREVSGYASHDAIVTAMLADPAGAKAVAEARKIKPYDDDRDCASLMLQFFSKTFSEGRNPQADFFHREQRAGGWAYRRKKTTSARRIAPDPHLSAVEGDPKLVFHLRRERDDALAYAKREAMRGADGHLECEACGFLAHRVYPGLSGDVYEIHHRLPLSQAAGKVTTRLKDLALLCANCHRAIHRTDPLMSVENFRAVFFQRPAR
jgi:hypothetical protein